jgi:AAA family ATP:ADP antiporter
MLKRLLSPIVEIRDREAPTVVMMFLYSFLAMTSYTMLKPATRSVFIEHLGAGNLPYVLLAAGFVIAFIMTGYTKGVSLLPRKWVIPIAQGVLAGLMLAFFVLFQTGLQVVSVLFYLFGLILGILVISQFWTLANDIFDPRQAKRVFGFIGGGASLGGILGSLVAQQAKVIGTYNLLLISASTLGLCILLVIAILRREKHAELAGVTSTGEEGGVGTGEALKLLRSSKHLQIIAMVIAFAAIGAGLIEQQLNMAAEAFQGRQADNLTSFLGTVQLWTSIIGFVIQIWLVSKIQRYLGIGFALLILPVSLGTTAVIMLLYSALWAPALARILDTSLRYTVDKTTREILFLPLPTDLKYQAKPFVDVTVDRFGKATSALLSLLLIAPWSLHLNWQQISFVSLIVTGLWIFAATRAKKGYLEAFRRSIEQKHVAPADLRIESADLSTIETLMEELADPDEHRVLYAIDVLESLEKRHLVTPLLLYHESPRVRARALEALSGARPKVAARWQPNVQRMLADDDTEVRVAAMRALAAMRQEQIADLIRPYLQDRNPRLASAAAVVLARSGTEADQNAAEDVLESLAGETGEATGRVRRDVARAVCQIGDARYHHILIPLLYDSDPAVAEEAMRSVRQLGESDYAFVPALVSLLRDRRLKGAAREVLVSYGEGVVDSLAFFLHSPEEDIWVRRHIPATLARIPTQKSMDALGRALAGETDGFLRFKLISAMDRLHREHPELAFDRKPVEALALAEGTRYFTHLVQHYNLFERDKHPSNALLARALKQKMGRAYDRVFLLLGLLYPWRDISAARWAIDHGDAKAKSSALEYLDNVLAGPFRKRLLPMFEDLGPDERVKRGSSLLDTRPRTAEETLLGLINDEDQVLSASAISLIAQTKLWLLSGDLEHVLTHRDVKDWYVFEAASWALAESRLSAEQRRALWLEPLPAVELAARLSALPLFSHTTVDELFRIAGASLQVRHERGKVLYQEGTSPSAVQFLLDGAVTVTSREGRNTTLTPPAPLAFDEVLQGGQMGATVRATDTSVCLVLTADEGRMLLANSTDLVQGLFGTILEHPSFAARRVLVRGEGGEDLARLAAEGVKPVERVLALQRIELFSKFPADELLQLANIASSLSFRSGETLFQEADPPGILLLLDGRISLEVEGAPPLAADAGDTVGIFETLAGVPVGRRAQASSPGAALRIDGDDLFDLIGQRPDLMRNLFTVLLGTRAEEVPVS